MKVWLPLLPALLTLTGCGAVNVVRLVSANNFALVQKGHYSGHLRIRNGDTKLEKLASEWRSRIEDDPAFLKSIGEKYFSLPAKAGFRFTSLAEDSVARRIVLRYFARDPKPIVYAGWQIQLVFDRSRSSLLRVYAAEVPLE